MHCLTGIDIGRADEPEAAGRRLAQALLPMLDGRPDHALHTATFHTPAGPYTPAPDLEGAHLRGAPPKGAPWRWRGPVLVRLEQAARGPGFVP